VTDPLSQWLDEMEAKAKAAEAEGPGPWATYGTAGQHVRTEAGKSEFRRIDVSNRPLAAYLAALPPEVVGALTDCVRALDGLLPARDIPGFACWGCDMGGAGYSSQGEGHHDDNCPVLLARKALAALAARLGEAK
jgi:hypothetical protein